MNVRASAALSLGRNFNTFGRVRNSLSMPSSKLEPSSCFFFFIKSATTDLDCPRFFMVKEPTLFNRMTSGMDGKMRHASRFFSRAGATTSTTFSANSCTKINEPIKILASLTSNLNCSYASSLRSSSKRYPTHSTAILGLAALIRFTAAVIDDWYCDSKTTYTTFMVGRPSTLSGTIRRDSEFVAVNMPPPPLLIVVGALSLLLVSVGSVITFNADEENEETDVVERVPNRVGLNAGCHAVV
mmetsp:Transcript_39754/g.44394  ORF Transcript_39754/g.44394 Transcript_39754/m.44394 type:complete len:242 (-) Transcript_39754:304-1029(-)